MSSGYLEKSANPNFQNEPAKTQNLQIQFPRGRVIALAATLTTIDDASYIDFEPAHLYAY